MMIANKNMNYNAKRLRLRISEFTGEDILGGNSMQQCLTTGAADRQGSRERQTSHKRRQSRAPLPWQQVLVLPDRNNVKKKNNRLGTKTKRGSIQLNSGTKSRNSSPGSKSVKHNKTKRKCKTTSSIPSRSERRKPCLW